MHIGNIFIHWLNAKSYLGDDNISNIQEINYKITDNKYIKIKTHGFIIKTLQDGSQVVIGIDEDNDGEITKQLST